MWFCEEARVMGQLDLCPLILSCPRALYELGVSVSGRVYKRQFDLVNMMNAKAYFDSFCQSLNRKNSDFAVSEDRWMADSFVNCFGNPSLSLSLSVPLRRFLLFEIALWTVNLRNCQSQLCQNLPLAPIFRCS